MAAAGVIEGFELPAELEAAEPPEARGLRRDEVRLLVSDLERDAIEHARFNELSRWLSPGDLLVVNTSGTLNAVGRGRVCRRIPPSRSICRPGCPGDSGASK